MVKIPFDFRAFVFHDGINRIQDAFRVAINVMVEAHRKAEQAHRQYSDSGADDAEYDENGNQIRSILHELEWAESEAFTAANLVREAFITSIFHYWERSARGWTNNSEDGFPKLINLVRDIPYPVSDDLKLLNSLNNLIKHDNPKRGREVFEGRRSLFNFIFRPTGNWREALRITNEDVDYFFEVVRASGPQLDI